MRIKVDDLHTILDKLKPVSLKDDMLVENFLGQLIFSEDGISIFNDHTYAFYPIETDLDCVISYNKLLSFITKTRGKMIKIAQKDGSVSVVCGRAKLSINSLLLNEVDLNTIEEIKKAITHGKRKELPESFNKGIEVCSPSASKDPAAGTLACICIDGDTIISTDKTRLSMFTMEEEIPEKDLILIGSDNASTIVKFGAVKYRMGKSWIVFDDGEDYLLAIRRIHGKYPVEKFTGLFDKFKNSTKIKLPGGTNRILELINSIVSETTYIDRFVHIEIKDDYLLLFSQSESAKIKEKVKIEYKGHPFKISINPSALQEALSMIDSPVLEKDKEEHLVLMQTENFKHIIALRAIQK